MGTPSSLLRRPVGGLKRERVLSRLGAVDEEVLPVGPEVPATVSSFVDVVVVDRLMDPAFAVGATVLDLGLAVDDTRGAVGIIGKRWCSVCSEM